MPLCPPALGPLSEWSGQTGASLQNNIQYVLNGNILVLSLYDMVIHDWKQKLLAHD